MSVSPNDRGWLRDPDGNKVPCIMVDHVAPGYVLLDCDRWGKFEPLTESPYLDFVEACETAEVVATARHLGIRFSQRALEAAHDDSVPPRTSPEGT